MSGSAEVAYGWHAVGTLLRVAPQRIQTLYLAATRKDPRARTLAARSEEAGVAVVWADGEQLHRLAGHTRHQGVVALLSAEGALLTLASVLPGAPDYPNPAGRQLLDPPLYLVLDGVTDPHNLGACLRSADAAGVRAVIVPKDRSVGVTAVVRKVASGATEAVPLVFVTNLARALDTLKAQGVWVVGLAGEGEELLTRSSLDGPVALVLGAEGEGLRRLTRERCDQLARLPMLGVVESLNVSVAAGVALYEVVRRRMG
ncbi:23S rRNA (guanosine(2251)-2'-O)-methyltransferase RlmB [Hydrogenophilus islandicus]